MFVKDESYNMNNVHFSHANGFPASSYSYLFKLLNNTRISFVEKMGHGDYPLNKDLYNFADELIESIEKAHKESVIGVGHSLGGVVTLLAASKRPDLFKKVIVLDPVLFSKRKRYIVWLLRKIGITDWLGVTKKAKKRRTHFSSLEEVRKIYKQKSLFKRFHQNCFEDYLKYGFIQSEKGVDLAFSSEVEADVFRYIQIQIPHNLHKLKGVLIYGNYSDTFWNSDMKWWKRNFPNFEIVPFEGGHLFPFEKPEETAKLLNEYIAK